MMIVIRAATIAVILTLPLGSRGHAQALRPIDFESLPRQQQPTRKPRPATSKIPTLPKPIRIPTIRIDTVSVFLVDTVRVPRVDTVVISRVDTVKVAVEPVARPAAAPAAVTPTFTASGLTQVMFAGGDVTRATYRLRRVEVKITADLGNRAQAIMMLDAAKSLGLNTSGTQPTVSQSSRILQDAFISMPVRRLTIEAGQQRLPLGYEGAMSSSGLETVERALMESDKSRGAAFGDVRDAGIGVRQTLGAIDYRVGVFNGSGETMNEVDKQVGKAVVGQLSFNSRSLKGLRMGLSGATSGSGAADNPTRDRIGADIRVVLGPVVLHVEGMAGQDGPTHRIGYYTLATFAPRPGLKLVSRIDVWDPDLASDVYPATLGECDYVGGFTWIPAGSRLKLQLNVVRKTYSAGLGPSSTLVLSQLQATW